ncbi:prealbumin-like fold domain-containing protein [Companilactobacillus allii]|nr:prealbumin-like fold domain-containing protein [Companilactobacillus allii]
MVGSYMTDKDGVIKVDNLPAGEYYFQETLPPDGYDINDEKIHFTITDKDIELGTLKTSDPKIKDTDDNNGEDDNDEDSNEEDNNGEDNNEEDNNEEDNNGEDSNEEDSNEEDNNDEDGDSGLITNPINPDENNNENNSSENTDESTVNPTTPQPPYEGNGDSSQTYLPQTSTDTGVLASIIGSLTLVTFLYFRRRKA